MNGMVKISDSAMLRKISSRATSASLYLVLVLTPCLSRHMQTCHVKGTPLSSSEFQSSEDLPSTSDHHSKGPPEYPSLSGTPAPRSEYLKGLSFKCQNSWEKDELLKHRTASRTKGAKMTKDQTHYKFRSVKFGALPTTNLKRTSTLRRNESLHAKNPGIDFIHPGTSLDITRSGILSQRLIRRRRSELVERLESPEVTSEHDTSTGEMEGLSLLGDGAGFGPDDTSSDPFSFTANFDLTTKGIGKDSYTSTVPESPQPQTRIESVVNSNTIDDLVSNTTKVNDLSIIIPHPDISTAAYGVRSSPSNSSTQPLPTDQPIWLQGVIPFAVYFKVVSVSRKVSLVLTAPAFPLSIVSAWAFTNPLLKNRVSNLIIMFNITEGLKAVLFIINRSWKLSLGNALINWSSPYTLYFIYVVTWVPDSLGRISLILNTVVSVDRFIKLVFPLKGRRWTVVTHPRLIIVLGIFVPTLVNSSSMYLLLTGVPMDNSETFTANDVVATIAVTAPQPFKIYRQIHIISSICFRYVPLLISITFNSIMVVSIIRHQKTRKQYLASADRKDMARRYQNNATIAVSMLLYSLAVSVKPLVRLVSMLHPTVGEGKRDMFVYALLNDYSLLLDVLSPVITFLTYLRLSSYFRRALRSMCGKPTEKSIVSPK